MTPPASIEAQRLESLAAYAVELRKQKRKVDPGEVADQIELRAWGPIVLKDPEHA